MKLESEAKTADALKSVTGIVPVVGTRFTCDVYSSVLASARFDKGDNLSKFKISDGGKTATYTGSGHKFVCASPSFSSGKFFPRWHLYDVHRLVLDHW